MRDDKWLFHRLDQVWDKYFSDIPQDNDVRIVWGRRARSRLGSIRQLPITNYQLPKNQKPKIKSQIKNPPATLITINSLFKDLKIPEYVVVGTIAHELSHYAHGFHSPIAQKYQTPHAGGVVRHEMRRRGLEKIFKAQKIWLKNNWQKHVDEKLPRKPCHRRNRYITIKWI